MAIPISFFKLKKNKKFWEELIAYYPFTEISVLDTRRKHQYICAMKPIKQ
jgi:hypothetical protein